MSAAVDHPSHYTDVVPGIECIQVTEHFTFLRGNAIKYLWRAGAKGNYSLHVDHYSARCVPCHSVLDRVHLETARKP